MSLDTNINSITAKIPGALGAAFDIAELKKLRVPDKLHDQIAFPQLEKMVAVAQERFKDLETADPDELFDFMMNGFIKIIKDLTQAAKNLGQDFIAECGVSEAVFSNALDQKPIVATDALATCIGVAGYEPVSKFGFVVHFSLADEVEESGRMLCEKIRALNPKAPVEIHLRGGVKGLSEDLAVAIEKWVENCNNNGCPMVIVKKEVCVQELRNAQGHPNGTGLSLDTRDGTMSVYEAAENPFSKIQDVRDATLKMGGARDDQVMDIFTKAASKKHAINVVYN